MKGGLTKFETRVVQPVVQGFPVIMVDYQLAKHL